MDSGGFGVDLDAERKDEDVGLPPFGRLKAAMKRVGVEERLKNLKMGSLLRIAVGMDTVFLEGIVVEMAIDGRRPSIDLKVLNTKLTPLFIERAQCRMEQDAENGVPILAMELDLNRFDVRVYGNVLKQFMDEHEAANNGNTFHLKNTFHLSDWAKPQSRYPQLDEYRKQLLNGRASDYKSVYQSFYTHSFSRIVIPNPLFFQ